MAQCAIDCLILVPGANFLYLTGMKFTRERHRLLAALFGVNGELAIMGPLFEEAKMQSAPVDAEIHTWKDEENQYRRVAELVGEKFGKKARVGLDLSANYYHYIELRKHWPQDLLVDTTGATDRVRAVKSGAEIQCLKEAAEITRAKIEKVPSRLVEGMTEIDLARLYGNGAMIQFGISTSLPNETGGTQKLQKGDAVVIDAGDRVEGYRSDLTRTFFFGKPCPKMREIYRIVSDAESAGMQAAKPGKPVEVIDIAVRAVIEKAGYGDYFTHRSGHGLGLDFHELPICVKGNTELLVPGMVLTVEPGIYLPGQFGVRLEDDILINDTGFEMISRPGPLQLG
jgi:Xaa-Pro dipeptidase